MLVCERESFGNNPEKKNLIDWLTIGWPETNYFLSSPQFANWVNFMANVMRWRNQTAAFFTSLQSHSENPVTRSIVMKFMVQCWRYRQSVEHKQYVKILSCDDSFRRSFCRRLRASLITRGSISRSVWCRSNRSQQFVMAIICVITSPFSMTIR